MAIVTKNNSHKDTQEKLREVESVYNQMLAETEELEKKKKEIIGKYVGDLEKKKTDDLRNLIQDKG